MFSFWSKKNLISYSLMPLAGIYGLVSKINIKLRGRNAYRSTSFVISVGNINVGGTGKTPLTIALANNLIAEGHKVAVIGHAYKAALENSEIVNESFSVEQIGDEAKQMLKMLDKNSLMIVGKKRLDSIKLAEENNADIIILDDGYTAAYIKRDLNIVVVDGKVQLGNQLVMPAGPLREPISGLKRSDCVVVINRQRNLDFAYNKEAFYLKSKISYAKKLATKDLFAFCGIGIPSKFYNSLNKEGLCIKDTRSFPDHHKYTTLEIENLLSTAKTHNLQLVTTLKDLVKVDSKFHKQIDLIMLELELTKGFKSFVNKKITEFLDKK